MSTSSFIGIDFSNSALLAEIKELAEKNLCKDGMVLLSIAAGYKQPIKPDMEFEYTDVDVQEDLYQLVEYSIGEVCTPKQHDKVKKIWSSFFEQVFGIASHSVVSEDKEENTVKAINNPIAESVNNIGEENIIPPVDAEKNVANKDDVLLCNAPEAEPMQIDAKIIHAKSSPSKQVGGFLEEGSSSSAGVKTINGENVLDDLKGLDYADGSREIDSKPSQGPLASIWDCVITKSTSSAISNAPEGSPPIAEDKIYREETEAYAKNERAVGELSPIRKLEVVQQICIERAPEEKDAMAGDEDEESVLDNSESTSEENGGVLESESVNGKGDDGNDDNADESEGEVDALENEETVRFFDHFLRTGKPLSINVQTKSHDEEENLRIFYGNDSFYLLLRLHQMLYQSMLSAKFHSPSSENRWGVSNDVKQTVVYTRFKEALRSLLNGSCDNAMSEDECRAIGDQSDVLFTLEKLIHKLVKQLQKIESDEMDNKLLHLYTYERLRNPYTFSEEVYCANARFLLPDDNLYRIEFLSCSERLTIQLLMNEHGNFEPTAVSTDPDFVSYLNDELLAVVPQRMGKKPGLFLKRNISRVYNGSEISNYDKAMEGLIVHNGMQIKINSVSNKISYVLDTEDFLYRKKSRRQALYHVSAASNGNSRNIIRGKLLFCLNRNSFPEAARR